MRDSLEGLDATAEAERAMKEVDPEAAVVDCENVPDVDTMRRALRDLEAAKSRVERDAQRAAEDLREKLVAELLPVLDNLDRTIRAAELAGESEAMLQGVRQVRSQFEKVLAKYGVERINSKHGKFDPRIHDAVSIVALPQPQPHDVVVDEVEAGYRFGDRLLRPAKVVVGRHTPRWHH